MDVTAIVPSRMGSTRYPGKPLADIQGLPMVEHVYRRTAMSDAVDETYVATPDEEIREAVASFGGEVITTGPEPSAVHRVAAAAREVDSEIVVVMQGDEPLVYPEMIDAAVQPFVSDGGVEVVNLAGEIESEERFADPNVPKVVPAADGTAHWFSRSPLPYLHDVSFDEIRAFRQVCVIPFRREFLFEYVDLPETPAVRAEGIDMLKVLEHGHDVHLVETDRTIHAVDTPEDHERVDALMAEDELFLAGYGD